MHHIVQGLFYLLFQNVIDEIKVYVQGFILPITVYAKT